MTHKTAAQVSHLIKLADTIRNRKQPLGVGLRNECWAGIAIMQGREANCKATAYFGISFSEIKRGIKKNNAAPAECRNQLMVDSTLALARE